MRRQEKSKLNQWGEVSTESTISINAKKWQMRKIKTARMHDESGEGYKKEWCIQVQWMRWCELTSQECKCTATEKWEWGPKEGAGMQGVWETTKSAGCGAMKNMFLCILYKCKWVLGCPIWWRKCNVKKGKPTHTTEWEEPGKNRVAQSKSSCGINPRDIIRVHFTTIQLIMKELVQNHMSVWSVTWNQSDLSKVI